MARNTNQVFGDNLDTPVDFVLFYAEETDNIFRPKGGTGQAVEMARLKGIPTFNMSNNNWEKQFYQFLNNKFAKPETSSTTKEIQKFLDEKFDTYLPAIQKIRGYKKIETKEDFLNLPQEKQESIIRKICKS
jgi:hypothetical protein